MAVQDSITSRPILISYIILQPLSMDLYHTESKGTFAVVLENPVCENDEAIKKIVKEFDQFCLEHGLKPLVLQGT